MLGLLLDGEAVAVLVELGHAVALGIIHPIAEHGGLFVFFRRTHSLTQHLAETVALEDVVAEHQTGAVVADEIRTDGERLSQAVGRRLLGVFEMHAVVAAVTQKTLESGQIERCGNNQDFADAGQHEHRYGIVDHGLVIDGHQLLGYPLGDGIQAGAGASGQYNSFHTLCLE